MCKKCLDKVKGMEIINVQGKVDALFRKIDSNPNDYKNDGDLIRLLDRLGELVDKYRKEIK